MSTRPFTLIDLPIADPTVLPSRWWIPFEIGSLLSIVACGIGVYTFMPDDPLPLYITAALLAFGVSLPFFLLRLIRRYRVAIEGDELVVRTGVGARRLSIANLRPQGLQVIDLDQHHEYDLRGRRWDATMAGLRTGLFKLANGERAILVVTDHRRVCRLRSDADNLTVLVSLKNPEPLRALIEA
jgi:hypothetical protein